VVAEVAESAAEDQMYRITFDGSVNDEHGYVAVGGQAEAIAAVLKEHYADNMTLAGALAAAIAGLGAQANGERAEITPGQLEVAVLDRGRDHRKFRRLTGARLESLLAEGAPAKGAGQKGQAQPGSGRQSAGKQAAGKSADGQEQPPADPAKNGQPPAPDAGADPA